MKNGSDYNLSAGEFAKLCHTTRDTLRYYEKMGILVPYRNEENSYHYYSLDQVTSFYFIQVFRKLECSVSDIKDYLLSNREEEFHSFLQSKFMELKKEREEMDIKIDSLSNAVDMLNRMQKNRAGEIRFETFDKDMYIKITPITATPATNQREIIDDIGRHLSICSMLPGIRIYPVGASFDREGFLRREYQYKHVFSFISENTKPSDTVFRLPSRNIISCVYRDPATDITSIYEQLQSFIAESGLSLISDVYSISLVNILDSKDERRYLKYIFGCV